MKETTMRIILMLLCLIFTNVVWAHKPGPDIIRESPICKSHIVQKTSASGNTFGARFWTDGKMIAPMLPDRPWLVKCPQCGALFWIDEAKEIGKQNPWDKHKVWPKAQKVNLPNEMEILNLIASAKLSLKKELYARRQAWWLANDTVRMNAKPTFKFTAAQEDNLNALAKLLDENEPNQRIMKAEIFREIGKFLDCIKLLNKPFNKNHHTEVAALIKKLAAQKLKIVHEITNN